MKVAVLVVVLGGAVAAIAAAQTPRPGAYPRKGEHAPGSPFRHDPDGLPAKLRQDRFQGGLQKLASTVIMSALEDVY